MALEALSTTELFNYILYDATLNPPEILDRSNDIHPPPPPPAPPFQQSDPVTGRKKRRRRPKVCKNKEEAETQRMTHIAVERNRRKQMNEHLSVLRSLMPESYAQRFLVGDQASIVGGAIDFVKELEHILQSLEAKKYTAALNNNNGGGESSGNITVAVDGGPFAQFFMYPQFSQLGNKYTSQSKAAVADIEVTLIETHANIRLLSRRRIRQLSKLILAFHAVLLSVLHLNITIIQSAALYSISAKVEEGCQLNSADAIAAAVHHMVRIIEEEDNGVVCGDGILGGQS